MPRVAAAAFVFHLALGLAVTAGGVFLVGVAVANPCKPTDFLCLQGIVFGAGLLVILFGLGWAGLARSLRRHIQWAWGLLIALDLIIAAVAAFAATLNLAQAIRVWSSWGTWSQDWVTSALAGLATSAAILLVFLAAICLLLAPGTRAWTRVTKSPTPALDADSGRRL